MLTSNRADRKLRNRREFIPSDLAGRWGARLENRALTAPLIYRQPAADPVAAGDFVSAVANGQPAHPQVYTDGDSAVLTAESPATGATFQIIESATADAVDVDNTFPPDLPNGTSAATMNVTASMEFSATGGFTTALPWAGTAVNGNTSRNYVLADNDIQSAGTPVTLVETFSLHCQPPLGYFGIGVAGGGLVSGNTTIGFNVNIGPPGVIINGTQYSASSGTITNPNGQIIAFGQSATELNVTITTPMTLPLAGRTPEGVMTGVNWPVAINAGVGIGGLNVPRAGSDSGEASAQYTMEFL